MDITIYGADGCATCSNLKEKTSEVIETEGFDATVEKVTDMAKLAEKGLMSTPVLEIDDDMVLQGANPSKDRLRDLIAEHR